MSGPRKFHSKVGSDGVLKLQIALGQDDAGQEVLITVEHASSAADDAHPRLTWKEFVESTYGSCADLALERPAD